MIIIFSLHLATVTILPCKRFNRGPTARDHEQYVKHRKVIGWLIGV